jgi:hypothetical protein
MDYCSTIVCLLDSDSHWASSLRFIPRLRVACLTLPLPHAADLTISPSVSAQYEYGNVMHAGCRAITVVLTAPTSQEACRVSASSRGGSQLMEPTNAESEACRAGPASSVSGHASMRWLLTLRVMLLLTNGRLLATSLEANLEAIYNAATPHDSKIPGRSPLDYATGCLN